jgi:predicted phage tail protein
MVVLGDVQEYLDTTVEFGTVYRYSIRAENTASNGPVSDSVEVLMPAPPSSPMDLTLFVGDRYVLLSWSPPLNDGGSAVMAYSVSRGYERDEMSEIARIVIKEYKDPDVAYGQTYYYSVRAINLVGPGEPTEPMEATPMPPPSAPTDLEVEFKDGDVILRWSEPGGSSAPLKGYIILRGETGDSLVLLAEVGLIDTYKDKNVPKGRTYYYSVRADSDSGEGVPTSPVKMTIEDTWDMATLVIIILIGLIFVLLGVLLRRGERREVEVLTGTTLEPSEDETSVKEAEDEEEIIEADEQEDEQDREDEEERDDEDERVGEEEEELEKGEEEEDAEEETETTQEYEEETDDEDDVPEKEVSE